MRAGVVVRVRKPGGGRQLSGRAFVYLTPRWRTVSAAGRAPRRCNGGPPGARPGAGVGVDEAPAVPVVTKKPDAS